jgi:hypothetical protein
VEERATQDTDTKDNVATMKTNHRPPGRRTFCGPTNAASRPWGGKLFKTCILCSLAVRVAVWGEPAVAQTSLDPPRLISPADGAILDNGRSDRQDSIVWDFVWEAVPNASRYHLLVQHQGSSIPVADLDLAGTNYHYVSVELNRFG